MIGAMQELEQIVFVDESGQPTGESGPKLASHTANTKLHLAFSCYIFRKSDKKFLGLNFGLAGGGLRPPFFFWKQPQIP